MEVAVEVQTQVKAIAGGGAAEWRVSEGAQFVGAELKGPHVQFSPGVLGWELTPFSAQKKRINISTLARVALPTTSFLLTPLWFSTVTS